MPIAIAVNGFAPIELVPTSTALTVGRGPDCDVLVMGDAVALLHGWVERRDTGWYYFDSPTSTGTFLDGRRVQDAVLRSGLVLRLGAPDGPTMSVVGHAEPFPSEPAIYPTLVMPSLASPVPLSQDSMDPGVPVRRGRTAVHRLGLVALAVVAVACVAFGAWAYRTGIGWQDDALAAQSALHASQADAATLTAKQKQLQADLTSTRSTLKQAQTQLRDYTQRVGDIANEKAAIADTAAAASDKAEQAAALATQAANVADTLDGCITHLNELLRAVANSDGSDYIAIQVQGASVNAECSAAQQANDELQTQLAEQTQ